MNDNISMSIDHAAILAYKRLGYKTWYAFAEFVDNSIQSYLDHKHLLFPEGGVCEIRITYDRDEGEITIYDNSMGMDDADLQRAMCIGKRPENTSGLSEYGLGLKTAACWFGDLWSVKTSKLNDEYEYTVTVDVEKIARGDLKLDRVSKNVPKEEHYTIITIKKLHRNIHGRSLNRIAEYVRSMYRVYLNNADIWVTIGSEEGLEPFEDYTYLKVRDIEQKRGFEHTVNGKTISGHVGILSPGGRRKAGIAIIRRGRVIKGQPDAWRPQEIFGSDSPNDTRNQRLVGEIYLDQFGISHTKDEILWDGDEEQELLDYLTDEFSDYISLASTPFKDIAEEEQKTPSEEEIQFAIDELRKHIESPDIVDAINLDEVPPDELVEKSFEPLNESAKDEEPYGSFNVGEVKCNLFLSKKASFNDPYFSAVSPEKNRLDVIINTNHIHYLRISGTGRLGLEYYFMECIYDALASWKASLASNVNHDTVKVLKDRFLKYQINKE